MKTALSTVMTTAIVLAALAWNAAPASAAGANLISELFNTLDKTELALTEAAVEVELVAIETKQIRRDVRELNEAFRDGELDRPTIERELDEAEQRLDVMQDRAKEVEQELIQARIVLTELSMAAQEVRSRQLRLGIRKAFELLETTADELDRLERSINGTRREIEQVRDLMDG